MEERQLNIVDFDTDTEKILLEGVYIGQYSAANIMPELYLHNYINIYGGVGYGIGWTDEIPKFKQTYKYAKNFRGNAHLFSQAKSEKHAAELARAVFDKSGGKRKFVDFSKIARQTNANYNLSYLRTEQTAAFRMSQNAEQWAQFEEEKDIFQYLQYQTVGDSKVRPEHAAWDGITLPFDDPFWDTHSPINDWNCRCRLIQLRRGEVTDLEEHRKKVGVDSLKNESKVFANNPAKSGELFTKEHPFFTNFKEKDYLKQPSDAEVRNIFEKWQ